MDELLEPALAVVDRFAGVVFLFGVVGVEEAAYARMVGAIEALHEEDVSGQILSSESDDWVHLCIPMRYDPGRHCITVPVGADQIVWEDPRTEDGELMWPGRPELRYGPRPASSASTCASPHHNINGVGERGGVIRQ
jgi:hypothetical protein